MALLAASPAFLVGTFFHLDFGALTAAVILLGAVLVTPRTSAYRRVRDENADLQTRCETLEAEARGCRAESAELRGKLEGLERYAAPAAFRELTQALESSVRQASAERDAVRAELRELAGRQMQSAEAVKFLADEMREQRLSGRTDPAR
jgi:predicted  nucleic acid-binding Zn-ribbon protein